MASGSEDDKQETRRDDLWDKYSTEMVESALFYCKLCSFDGKSVEDFTTHLNRSDHEVLRVNDTKDRCPVPDGYDARLVGPSIKQELKKLHFVVRSSTHHQYAVGNLNKTPHDVLHALSSSGILLQQYYVDGSDDDDADAMSLGSDDDKEETSGIDLWDKFSETVESWSVLLPTMQF
ncbi:hypothetical protein EUTSA_v10010918mg [Eutrema salsugineum]|uniref:Uncharacterized protein n=1 Tax=Eutrema salsugineum TaxID=72664 RepID=V4LPJ1_EUTSA|nr:hypothetical protein EUTSA_v10010918mg [Eutrema salsugineum]